MNKKKALIISFDNLETAPRFFNMFETLKEDYEIEVAGYYPNKQLYYTFHNLLDVEKKNTQSISFHYNYNFILKKIISFFIILSLKIQAIYSSIFFGLPLQHFNFFKFLSKKKYDLIVVHHLSPLLLGIKLKEKSKCKLILNAHEYYPLEFDADEAWVKIEKPNIDKFCEINLPKVDLIISVSTMIVEMFQQNYNVKTFLFPNAKANSTINPSNVDETKIKIISHGVAIKKRKIEEMIEIVNYLPSNYYMDFMLMPVDKVYYNELLKFSSERIKFIDVVPMSEIISKINEYDIGLYYIDEDNFNHKYCLPNKFFEFIQAKLCIAISPNPEMKSIVEHYKIGIVSEDYDIKSFADKIKELRPEKIRMYKEQTIKAANELSLENFKEKLVEEIRLLVS